MMSESLVHAPVLIAGGGPVGMTLALELARHGVRSILVERNSDTTRHPKMDLTNGRSMELYRRLGLSDRLRAVGVPAENPWPIIWCTSPSGHLLSRFDYPSADEQRLAVARANDGTGTAEPGMRISQIVLEPVLKQAILEHPIIDARFGIMFDSLMQDDTGVTAMLKASEGEGRSLVRADYLIGCDGGGSRVRRSLDIALEGNDNVGRIMMIHFRSQDRDILSPFGIAWHLQSLTGSLVAQDDIDTWTAHLPLLPGTDESTLDPAQMLRDFVGQDFKAEILMANPWTPRLVIAERYVSGRVILAGDAAHQVIPTGGYGMNTGVGDAIDLGWKLAAIVNGWGGDDLLASYEVERMAIAVQNREASERHFAVRMEIAAAFMEAMADGPIDEGGSAGDARRAKLGARITELGNAENESWGIEHGFIYPASSPILAPDDGPPPSFDPLRCIPSIYPGSRLPHLILEDGEPLLDKLGREYSLLVKGDASHKEFLEAASDLDLPLAVVALGEVPALSLLDRDLILVRPDGHVAWRGNDDTEAAAILGRAAGRQFAESARESETAS